MDEKLGGSPGPFGSGMASNSAGGMGAGDNSAGSFNPGAGVSGTSTGAAGAGIGTQPIPPVSSGTMGVNVGAQPIPPANPGTPTSPISPATPIGPAAPTSPIGSAAPIRPAAPTSTTAPAAPATSVTPASLAAPVTPTAPAKPKSRKGLIIGLAAAGAAAVVAIVAVVLVNVLNRPNPVMSAFERLLNEGLPKYVGVNGTVSMVSNDPDSAETIGANMDLTIDAQLAPASLVNTANVSISTPVPDSGPVTIDLSELYSDKGNLYLKISGIDKVFQTAFGASGAQMLSGDNNLSEDCLETGDCDLDVDALNDYGGSGTEALNDYSDSDLEAFYEYYNGSDAGTLYEDLGVDADTQFYDDGYLDEYNNLNDYTTSLESLGGSGNSNDDSMAALGSMFALGILGMFQTVDDQWILLGTDTSSTTPTQDNIVETINDSCEMQLLTRLRSSGDTLAKLYKQNPFVVATDKDVTVASKHSTVYRVSLDQEKYKAFIDAANNPENLFSDYFSCSKLSVDDLYGIGAEVPTFYAEADDGRFTRIYWSGAASDSATITLDLDLSYPDNLNVVEPKDYTTLEELSSQ